MSRSDSDPVGQTIMIDGRATSIIGVLPRGFRFPADNPDFWQPLVIAGVPFMAAFTGDVQLLGGAAASGGTELDLYGGYAFKAGPVGLDFGAIYYLYNEDQEDLGGDEGYDYYEIYGKASISWFALQVYYTPDYLGEATETAADGAGKDTDFLYVNLLAKTALMQGFNALDEWGRFDEAFARLRLRGREAEPVLRRGAGRHRNGQHADPPAARPPRQPPDAGASRHRPRPARPRPPRRLSALHDRPGRR